MNCVQKTNKQVVDNFKILAKAATFITCLMVYCIGVVYGTMEFFWEAMVNDQSGLLFMIVTAGLVIGLTASVVYIIAIYSNCQDSE